jgi:hypothetical protein
VSEPEYRRRYAEQLALLDPAAVWNELHALAGGDEPVLLCWERKADLEANRVFCHRRIVAAWLEAPLGQIVAER